MKKFITILIGTIIYFGCTPAANRPDLRVPAQLVEPIEIVPHIVKRTVLVRALHLCANGLHLAWGTGVIMRSSGQFSHILSTHHIVDGPGCLLVSLRVSRHCPETNEAIKAHNAIIYTQAAEHDLVILKVNHNYGVQTEVERNKRAGIGDSVHMLGFPVDFFAAERQALTYTKGTISTVNLKYNNTLHMKYNLPMQTGSSGSGIFNEEGKLISIAAFIAQSGEVPIPGYSFGVCTSHILDLIDSL